MDTEDLKVRISNVIDQWRAEQKVAPSAEEVPEVPRVLPEGKRVVRTKTSGDRVYLLDDVAKTRSWITNTDVLDGLGFIMADVTEIDDTEFLKYEQSTALYKAPDA